MRKPKVPFPEPKVPLFERICDDIDGGGLSILSDKARDHIKNWVRISMEDGYNRGYEAGYKKASTEADENAAHRG